MEKKNNNVINIKNKRAEHEYFLMDTLTAGLVLTGTEIKSIRNGKAGLADSYCMFKGDELFVVGMHIAEYDKGTYNNHDPKRDRKLLLTARELRKLKNKVQEKGFVGTNDCPEILFISVFRKRDERTVYNMIYRDGGPDGYVMVKRFSVTSVTRDKDYLLTKGTKGSKVLYFTANPNGEAEVVTIHHISKPKLKKTSFDFDFKTLAIKGRQSMGNILTRNAVRSINLKDEGISTLSARKIWFDWSVKRLNVNVNETNASGDERTSSLRYLGEFHGNDKILALMQSASYRITNFDLANHYDDDLAELRKFNPKADAGTAVNPIVTVLYRSADGYPYLKRFLVEATDRKTAFLDDDGSQMLSLSFDCYPRLEVVYNPESGKKISSEIIEVEEFIGVKSLKAKGKRITTFAVDAFNWLAPLKSDPEPATSELQPPTSDRLGFAEGTQTQLF